MRKEKVDLPKTSSERKMSSKDSFFLPLSILLMCLRKRRVKLFCIVHDITIHRHHDRNQATSWYHKQCYLSSHRDEKKINQP